MRVLLIDDDPASRHFIAAMIASSWPEAIVEHYDLEAKGRPGAEFPLATFDLVLLDYRLGQDDGLDWLQDFKLRPNCPPTVILTGEGNETVAVRAMKLGADNYLSKQQLSKNALAEVVQDAMHVRMHQAGSTQQMDAPVVRPNAEFHLSGYRLLGELGRGAASRVCLVVPEGGGEPLVAKVLLEELVQDHDFLARFLNEHKIAAMIKSDYVGKIFNYGFSDTSIYILMEYLRGGDLRRYFTDRHVSQGQILTIFRQVLMALRDIHAVGVVHRDLKPHNVMFRGDGSVALVDFGIAKIIDEPGITRQGTFLGSPTYTSPEMILGRPVDARSDLYSAGIMLYKMLTKNLPFQGNSAQEIARQHISAPVPPLPRSQDEFQPLIDGLLAKNPDARLASADAALKFINKVFYGQE